MPRHNKDNSQVIGPSGTSNMMTVLPSSIFSPPVVSSSKAVGLTSVVLPKNQIILPGKSSKRGRVVRISKKNIKTPVVIDDLV